MRHLLLLLVVLTALQSTYAQKKSYILVHGAWHGAWCWKKVVPLLQKNGHKAIALDLPGHGDDKSIAGNVTFADYVKKVVDTSNEISGPVILVGHSMAGVVIAQAAEELGPEKVEKLVFLDAFMPRTGESVFMLAGKAESIGDQKSTLIPNLLMSADNKTNSIKVDAIQQLFYHDCSSADIDYAKKHVGQQSIVCLATPVSVTDARYGVIPKTYILCTEAKDLDKTSIATNVPIEKLFKLASSHSPFFSMPDKLVEFLMK
jgi:pimeloyl-ACP methyl ester carboxylesterase